MENLLEIINTIAKPDFKDKYNVLTNKDSAIEDRKRILEEWNLFSEIELIEHDEIIKEKIITDTRLKRIYRKDCFKHGEYDFERYIELIKLTVPNNGYKQNS